MKKIDEYLESIFPMDSYKDEEEEEEILRNKYPTKEQEYFEKKDQERVMIDFDGVIHSYDNGWQGGEIYGNVIEGAKEAIDVLKEKYQIVIFTTRASKRYNDLVSSDKLVADISAWLKEHDIYFDEITGDKLGAFKYIDDKAIKFLNWEQVLNEIREDE